MTSDTPKSCYVWIWLPNQTTPVVAGRITHEHGRYLFTYGRSYLNNSDAIAIDPQALPLQEQVFEKKTGTDGIHGAIRDSSPDAWGRRVILNTLMGLKGRQADTGMLDEMTYMLESGSDRIGALDFQLSAREFIPRISANVSLAELQASAELVDQGIPLTYELAQALNHGTSIGGARPKVLIESNDKKYIAKFSSSTDQYNVIKAEYVGMKLAKACRLNVADVQLEKVAGKDILLIERFDREQQANGGWSRKLMLSALTLLDLDEMTSRYASYGDFAEIIRHRFDNPLPTLQEMFSRIVFNILIGNTDDHARNHAAFWDGKKLLLTPAYDLCPQLRHGGEASQAMAINGNDNSSRLATCLMAAGNFMLTEESARCIIDNQIAVIRDKFETVCDEAGLQAIDRELLMRQMILQPYAFEGY